MFRKSLLVLLASAFTLSNAYAADAPEKKKKKKKVEAPVAAVEATSDFDFAFGGAVKSRYLSRGLSNSAMNPAANVYGEIRFKEIFYTNVTYNTNKLPVKPNGEVDLSIGARPVIGSLTTDIGAIYYWYPGSNVTNYTSPLGATLNINGYGVNPVQINPGANTIMPGNINYFEGYVKPSYAVTDKISLGGNVFYGPSLNNNGAWESYVSGTFKVMLPYDFAVSGEFGRQFLGTTKAQYGSVKLPEYNTWNVGLTYTYKQASLDLRYSGTDLNKTDCYVLTSDPKGITSGTGRSKWCGNTFLATLSVDFVYSELNKK